jgi:hypothetical protein
MIKGTGANGSIHPDDVNRLCLAIFGRFESELRGGCKDTHWQFAHHQEQCRQWSIGYFFILFSIMD